MESLPSGLHVGVITHGEYTPEQAAASDWLADAGARVTPVRLAALADADPSAPSPLASVDVCWWHRDRPLAWVTDGEPAGEGPDDPHSTTGAVNPPTEAGADADPVTACGDTVTRYLAAGGGLLLTLHGLSAVEPWGIDPVAPDATGHETRPGPTGYLVKAVHADHPAFETFDVKTDPAIYTRAGDADTAFARYETLLPAEGDVLAAGIRGDDPMVGESPLVEWRVGELDDGDGTAAGRVVGAGAALSFGKPRDYEAAAAGEQLVANLLTVLGGDRRPTFDGRPSTADGMQRLRRRLADDHHRPQYHVSPPANWLNDPNGLIEYEGTYHLFYQYNPGGPYHGSIHWGHAVSDDLVTWHDEPVALAPDPDGPDRDGCWSGCAVLDDDGTPTLLYTGGRDRKQLPCLATATDETLRTWRKDPRNPIIPEVPSELAILETADWEAEFRDHNVFRQDGDWYQVIGSGLVDRGGTALLYRGTALDDWTFVGQLLTGEPPAEGAVWECPELLDLGDKQLLHVSVGDRVVYFLGEADLSSPAFEVLDRGLLDHGDFYAPQSMRTSDDRILTWGWLPAARDVEAQWRAGWSGTLSLPRELGLVDGTLHQRPARELTALREDRLVDATHPLPAGGDVSVTPSSAAVELRLQAVRDPGAELDVVAMETPARTERTVLRWSDDRLVLDRSRSSRGAGTETPTLHAPLSTPTDDLSLRLFIDGSTIEVFAGQGDCLTGRIYPTRADATGLRLRARGGGVDVDVDAWTLGHAFSDAVAR